MEELAPSPAQTSASTAQDHHTLFKAPAETFPHDWYIIVQASFQDPTNSTSTPNFEEMEQKVASLHSSLQSGLSGVDVQLLPDRFIDTSQHAATACSCWLVGLPSMASADVAAARKKIRAWEAGVREEKCAGRKVRALFVKREVVLQQDLKPDVLVEGPSASGKNELEARMKKTGESFRKVKGSNPAQVRKQFLLHVMGGEPEKSGVSESKLRPPRDVLSRLKHDARYRVEEYVVGYIDRKAGMLEKSVADWQEYQEQELIAYFKHVPANEIVWDRASKVDLVFNPRSG